MVLSVAEIEIVTQRVGFGFFLFFVDCASPYYHDRKTNLMHNLFLVYFINLYLSVRIYTYHMLCIYTYVILNYPLFRIISTNCCIHMVVPPDDGPKYA